MYNSEKKSKSLIMCVTPLQMLIAEKIIELNSDQIFDLLVIPIVDNEKHRTYFNRLKKYCVNSLYYLGGEKSLSFFDYLIKLNKYSLDNKYSHYYLASIDSRHFQYLISKKRHPSVFTFDDGTGNIIPNELYYLNSKPSFLKRVAWRFFGVRFYMEDIKKISSLHYTIYNNVPNIIENKEYIPLFAKKNEDQKNLKNEVKKFYLGQPLSAISNIFDIPFVKKYIDKLEIDYYYPHPHEKLYPEGSFQVIDSPLIFEDYIIKFLKDNPNVNVEIFSFISSALLNIASLDRLQAIYIHDDQFFKLHHDFYNFAQELFSIPHIDLDADLK